MVPASMAEVTSEWLAEVLRAPARLVGAERFGHDFGLTSVLLRCRLEGARSVVVKLWASDGQAGSGEVLFYSALAPRLGIRVPHCYYGSVDEATRRGVLVLEDLDGARQGNCLVLADPRDAAAIAATLATLHATWWGRPDLAALPQAPLERELEWLETRSAQFLERFRADPGTRSLLENVLAVQARARERLADAVDTLVHADLHLDNVLFEDGERPVVLDWARAARGPAAIDLVELLLAMTPLRHFDDTFRIYTEGLRGHGIEVDAVALRQQVGGALLRKLIRETCGVALWEPAGEREQAILRTTMERNAEAIEWWRARDPELFHFTRGIQT
jgi:thiamine kinase-like enzyme